MIFFVMFLLYPGYYRRNYLRLIQFIHLIVLAKYFYVLTYEWYDDTTTKYLQVLGLTTEYKAENKFFKSNLLNNNWLIVLLSYIQYRTYKSSYYQNNLQPLMLEKDQKDFARKHPKWTALLDIMQEIAYMSVPWISFIVFIMNAFLNDKNCINFVIYAYSLLLITLYVASNKDSSNSVYRLMICWNFGIMLSIFLFLTILTYQVV